ncbi:N6-adenosine-methyltransferase subunit mettl14 [Gonapodya sp. JEL0774]|nr:N6-adenosine-methyltransferase subunit mettl14 [Gonapodya sp. JEL0774]
MDTHNRARHTLHRVIRARQERRRRQRDHGGNESLAGSLEALTSSHSRTSGGRIGPFVRSGINLFDDSRLVDAQRAGYALQDPPDPLQYVPTIATPLIPQATTQRPPQKGEKKEFDFDSARTVRNDFSQHFVDSGRYPANFIRDSPLEDRFEEYPKLKELVRLKNEQVKERATPPQYIRANLRTFDLTTLGTRFDVILIDPPLEEYYRRYPAMTGQLKAGEDIMWTFDEIATLPIQDLAANPSFIFIWVGCAEGLDKGRDLLNKWGYRRAEDITWLKTNSTNPGHHPDEVATRNPDAQPVFRRVKEHCIMGIRGTVRRSTDGHFIHCNVDTDVILADERPAGDTHKPEEIYHIIEHFCLGRRRLELFGTDANVRPGWLTIGADISGTNFDANAYNSYFSSEPDGYLVRSTPEIENLRPKSPPPQQGGKTRGVGGAPRVR